jgi:hypothetical protein
MESSGVPQKFARILHLRLVASVLAIGLVAVAALVVPYMVRAAHAAAPTHVASGCAQPPAGKDPSTFTGAQLRAYGLPPHQARQNQATWEALAKLVKQHVCTPTSQTKATNWPRNGYCTQCWGGIIASNDTFWSASATWTIPCVPWQNVNGGEWASMWVGFGGTKNNNLVQVGVEIKTAMGWVRNNGQWMWHPFPVYSAWFENVADPTDPNPIPSAMGVNCGDTIYAEVINQNIMYIMDETTGQSDEEQFGPAGDNSTAECIVEDPAAGAVPLMNFGKVLFSDCSADDLNVNQIMPLFSNTTPSIQNGSDVLAQYAIPSPIGREFGEDWLFGMFWQRAS